MPVSNGIVIGSNLYSPLTVDTNGYAYADLAKSSITASGNISLITNGINSLNNVNANDASHTGIEQPGYNREVETYGPGYTDDRALYVWDMTTTSWGGQTEAVMKPSINTSGEKTGAMDWMFVNNSQSVQINGSQVSNSWTIRGGDFTYNDVGKLFYIFLHDMNWSGGNDNWYAHGSVQWGKGTDNEGGAYNWHRASQDRLELVICLLWEIQIIATMTR